MSRSEMNSAGPGTRTVKACELPPNFPDITKRPPTVPCAIGSKMYPREVFKNDLPVAVQMRVISLRRRNTESQNFFNNKHEQYLDFREYYGATFNYCSICSEFVSRKRKEMKLVTHVHHSSLNYRINSDHKQSRWAEFFCYSCQVGFHSYKSGERYPVLVTSSMLLQWQGIRSKNLYPGDRIHVDQVGVSGARIEELEHAFMAEYYRLRRPYDVLVVSGYNDLLKGRSPEDILEDLRSFKKNVLQNTGSSFGVSTIPLAPAMSKLEKDTYTLAKPNMTERIQRLNDLIIDLNVEYEQPMNAARAPRFHTWGLTSTRMPPTIGPRNRLESMPSHALEDWRERRPSNQIHLSDEVRLRMGRATIRYFMAIYGIDK